MKEYRFKIGGRELKGKVGDKIVVNLPIEVKAIDEEKKTLVAVVSTEDTDRHGDVVLQSGWDLKPYNQNPVILDSHNYDSVTEIVGRALRTEVVTKGKKQVLEQEIEFAVAQNPKAAIIFALYAGGFAKAFSVGFIVREFAEVNGETDWWTIAKAELLEVSAVSVPANARALAKSKGIDVDALEPVTEKTAEDAECICIGDDDNEECTVHFPKTEEEPEAPADPQGEPDEIEEVETAEEETPAEDPAPEPEAEPTPEPEPVQASFRVRTFQAVLGMNARQRKNLSTAYAIIGKMLEEDGIASSIPAHARKAVHKRKLNQAVRAMLDAKE